MNIFKSLMFVCDIMTEEVDDAQMIKPSFIDLLFSWTAKCYSGQRKKKLYKYFLKSYNLEIVIHVVSTVETIN